MTAEQEEPLFCSSPSPSGLTAHRGSGPGPRAALELQKGHLPIASFLLHLGAGALPSLSCKEGRQLPFLEQCHGVMHFFPNAVHYSPLASLFFS